MKKILTLSAALLLVASMASASGVNLTVTDCASGGTGSNAITNACTANTGTYSMYASVKLPQGLPGFVACASIIDVQSSAAALPDWWHFDVCRSGLASEAADGTIGSNCGTLWDAAPNGAVVSTFVNFEYNSAKPNRIRMDGVHFVPSDKLYDLTDTADELTVLKVTISKTKTTGTGLCAGCSTPACIVLNEINFQPLVGDASAWLRVTNADVANYVNYNNATNLVDCPTATPTQNRTWGSVKAMYR